MENCLFCKIVNGDIPCHKIYEDDDVLAFLDITNDPEGHTLVVPKVHATNMFDCDAEVFKKVSGAVQKISKHYRDIGYAQGINVYINNEKAAGQEVMHLHVHILPRKENDGVNFARPGVPSVRDIAVVANELKLK